MGAICSGGAAEEGELEIEEKKPSFSATRHVMAFTPPETSSEPLCKFGCGRMVAEAKGSRKFDTCCRPCAVTTGGCTEHDPSCRGFPPSSRVVCPKGARCKDRTEKHLAEMAHPLDSDYLSVCGACGQAGEVLSLKILFDWTDSDGSGKLSRDELAESMQIIANIQKGSDPLDEGDGTNDPDMELTDEAWHHLDEDGNGVVNFNEFACWAGPRLGLPLGLKARGSNTNHTPCSVLGCPCEAYCEGPKAGHCKFCKHKQDKHKAPEQEGDVEFPPYWEHLSGEFAEKVDIKLDSKVAEFQQLLDKTYKNCWTRDRKRHHPDNPKVPQKFRVVGVSRNENSSSWAEFYARRCELLTRNDEARDEGKPTIQVFDNVKTVQAFKEIGGATSERLHEECNEWYLFHGTSPAAAKAICESDFRVSRAGSNTGTLYGKGLYFAESCTKADEYAKANESGTYALLICRVLGGNVLYTADATPDPESLVFNCVEGPYDSVLGDREMARGTFREFVLFDSEDVYVEYIIHYKREY